MARKKSMAGAVWGVALGGVALAVGTGLAVWGWMSGKKPEGEGSGDSSSGGSGKKPGPLAGVGEFFFKGEDGKGLFANLGGLL